MIRKLFSVFVASLGVAIVLGAAPAKAQNDQYEANFAAWKQKILATPAVTEIATSGACISVWIRLTPDKYESVSGAQSIARQLAISYCQATGVQRANFYAMLGSQQFADAWSQ
jgi:hypothetical protein